MPVYVYKNLKTGETFEVEQRITESALSSHPETGDPVKRLIQPVGIAFKGSGFYVNDSKNSAPSKKADVKTETAKVESTSDASKSDAAKSDTPKTEGAKTESKPEAKAAPKTESKATTASA